MSIRQAKIDPLPSDIDLNGQTAVVTGASAGIGQEVARQLLRLRVSTLILAVRSVAKGEACARALQTEDSSAVIKVLEFDAERYESIQQFAAKLRETVPVVNYLILNAGVSPLKLTRSANGHECTLQVNYYANVLLLAELLPYLEAGAEQTGVPARVSWVGSRRHATPSFEHKSFGPEERVLKYLDTDAAFVPIKRYGDSKLLSVLFMYNLAPRLDPTKVIVNMVCPGFVNTSMSDVLPWYIRPFFNMLKACAAKPVEQAAWVVLHSALVAGPESHGRFLHDKTLAEYVV